MMKQAEIDLLEAQSRRRPIFANVSDIKAAVRDKVMDNKYDVRNFYFQTGHAQAIARASAFETIVTILVALNAVWIAFEIDHNNANSLVDSPWWVIFADVFFCITFSSEILIRFLAFADKGNCLRDAWFVFDSVLVSLMVVETAIVPLLFLFSGLDISNGTGVLANTPALRVLRLMKVFRLGRMARLVQAIPEMTILVNGIFGAVRTVGVTVMLLSGVTYLFGVVLTVMLKSGSHRHTMFSSILKSMDVLWKHGALRDDVEGVTEALKDEGAVMVLLFYLYILISSLLVLNLLIGVLCKVVASVGETEEKEVQFRSTKAELLLIFPGEDETVTTLGELLVTLQKRKATETLMDMGVDPVGLMDVFSEMIATDGINKSITFADFLEVCEEWTVTNAPTVKNIVDLKKGVDQEIQKLSEIIIHHQLETAQAAHSNTGIHWKQPRSSLGLKFDA